MHAVSTTVYAAFNSTFNWTVDIYILELFLKFSVHV